jgi:predicted metalloprotease
MQGRAAGSAGENSAYIKRLTHGFTAGLQSGKLEACDTFNAAQL